MLEHDVFGRHTFNAGKTNVVFVQFVYHVTSGPQCIISNGTDGQTYYREYACTNNIVSGIQGRNAQYLCTEDQDQGVRYQSGNRINKDDISRICPECGNAFYPVLAPAVIVAVQREDKLLLAHNARFKENLYGLVAGFVEAGENLETAVEREVREEVGISIGNISYYSSQVWPFPNSLMVGFFADYIDGEIAVDGREITDADWFSVDEFPTIPRHGSIARKLIDEFVNSVRQ